MTPSSYYVLMFRNMPLSLHRRFEGGSEKMASYSAERQKDMRIILTRVED